MTILKSKTELMLTKKILENNTHLDECQEKPAEDYRAHF